MRTTGKFALVETDPYETFVVAEFDTALEALEAAEGGYKGHYEKNLAVVFTIKSTGELITDFTKEIYTT